MQKGIFLFLLLFACFQSNSQTKITPAFAVNHKQQPKTLLWRITGNGLKSPSYLFGTIHLTDKRVFNFDDSVYHTLERCEGMAIEVNPDELMGYYINKSVDEKTTRIKDILPEKEFNRYAKKLSARLKKPADEITSADIVREKNSWSKDLFSKGEMQTFVDAYLYGLARKQGKWVGGIEDISDQTGLLENFDQTDLEYLTTTAPGNQDASKRLDRMIELYMDQDLESIYEMVGGSSIKKDLLLTRRNIKMARRMDSLSAIRSMFFAVGAAHLPGDSGVIELLKRRGFAVEPVASRKKIPAEKYQSKEVELQWVSVSDNQELYNVMMPGNPASIKMYGLVDMKFHVDITNITGYYTLVSPMLNQKPDLEELTATFAKGMFASTKSPPVKKIKLSGIEGREFTQAKDGLTYKVRLFVKDGLAYSCAMFSVKSANLEGESASRFFNSFEIHARANTTKDMQYHVDSVMGLKMLTPAPFEYTKQFSDNTNQYWKVTAYTSSDAHRSLYLMLFSKEIKPGYHIVSDSTVHADLIGRMADSYENITQRHKVSPAGKLIEFEGRNKESAIHMKGFSIVRNNRNILLMLLGDSTMLASEDVKRITGSMEFFEQPAKWSWQTHAERGFKAWLPGEFRTFNDNEGSNYAYGYDTATATTFIVIADTLNQFTRYASDSLYWSNVADEAGEGEIVLSRTKIKVGELDGVELLMKDSSSFENYTRLRVVLSDSILYKHVVYAGRKYLFSDEVNKFFTNFTYPHKKRSDFLTRTKTKQVLHAFTSSSMAERHSAYIDARGGYYNEADLPDLHAKLFDKYFSIYDSSESTAINFRIAELIANVHSPTSITFVKNAFPQLVKQKSELQQVALYMLGAMKTKEAFSALQDCIGHYSSPEMPTALSDVSDSLQLNLQLVPALLKRLHDTTFTPVAAVFLTQLIDSSLLDVKTISPVEIKFIEAAEQIRVGLLSSSDRFIWEHYKVIQLLNQLNTPASLKMLAAFMEPDIKYFRKKALMYLIEKKYPVTSADIEKVASDPEIATSFYHELKELNQEELFPKKYLNARHFSHSDVNSLVEDSEVEKITFLKTASGRHQNKKYTFYLYSIKYSESSEVYLGISGGYEKNALEPSVSLSTILNEPMQDNVSKQLEEYLLSMEE